MTLGLFNLFKIIFSGASLDAEMEKRIMFVSAVVGGCPLLLHSTSYIFLYLFFLFFSIFLLFFLIFLFFLVLVRSGDEVVDVCACRDSMLSCWCSCLLLHLFVIYATHMLAQALPKLCTQPLCRIQRRNRPETKKQQSPSNDWYVTMFQPRMCQLKQTSIIYCCISTKPSALKTKN